MRAESGTIRTVLGDVPADGWGVTNAHAHLACDLFSHHQAELYSDYLLTVSETSPELSEFAARGGHALVDCTPAGLGRDPLGVQRLSRETGVHVVFASGIYHDVFHPHGLSTSENDLYALFVREVTEGIDGTGVRAGLIGEIGTYQHAMTDAEVCVFRAAGRAAVSTGVAVTTHTHLGELAFDQVDLLLDQGLDPRRIVIGHLDDLSPIDLELCRGLLRRGVYVQLDAVGCEYLTETLQAQMPTDVERVAAVVQLAEEGFADQVIMASDICRRRHLRVNGGPGLGHLAGSFRDLAVSAGMSADLLRRVLVDNPRDVLTVAA